MACVILPSETARLVYGYLVKENLNNIASQFLESSPYLTDCCQIVKNGYQFNTQLMGKNLQDLLQEYSVIHNLVNNKVGLLSKTSLLYKRIKLRCESLSEILELILFWKYKNLKNEDLCYTSVENDKKDKDQTVDANGEMKTNSDNIYSNNSNSVCNNSNTANNSDLLVQQNNDTASPENYHSQLNSENYLGRKQMIQNEQNASEEVDIQVLNSDNSKKSSKQVIPIDVSQNSQINENSNFSNSVNTAPRISVNHVNNSPVSELNLHSNILTIDINSPNKNLMTNEPSNEGSKCNEEANEFENQIKIVRIEKENSHQNHDLNSFLKPVMQQNDEVNIDNSSVVFVGPEVNVAIDQDRSQIIVIPIDYYKSQNNPQNKISMNENQKNEFFQPKQILSHEKTDVIFQDMPVNECTTNTNVVTSFYNELLESPGIDENIITESDFLQNKELMLNTAKEQSNIDRYRKRKTSRTLKINSRKSNIHPVIAVPQIETQRQHSRYRAILPKKDENQVHPVVVVQPLVENNQDAKQTNPSKILPETKDIVNNRKVKKKILSVKKNKTKNTPTLETLNMPSIKTPTAEKNSNESKADKCEGKETSTTGAVIEPDVINEEKENLEETKTKKTETPIFVSRRNSKRLSLSTPRRRTHIRALEFETPPKTKEGKKSRTSPKVKTEPVKVERKSVRNTLFKSPIPENVFKSPSVSNCSKKGPGEVDDKTRESSLEPLAEPLGDLNSIPIATRSPNRKLSDAWENLTGVGCVIGQTEDLKSNSSKKMWDADLRSFIPENCSNVVATEKTRVRKPEKNQKDNRKSVRKKPESVKKCKKMPVTISPSKMSLTAKRNTYSINKNEEASPTRTLLDDLKLVTPFKDIDAIRPTEETPLTKLLRENINTIDIDLSMINTPSFPPTPSIVITPDLDDVSLITGTNYYTPAKECSKEKLIKITDFIRVDTEDTSKKETKEMHEKVIDDLVCKAKEIIGIGKESQEDLKNRPSGKILSMVKIQMLTQCDKKLCENIPINEEANFSVSFANQSSSISNLSEVATKLDLKEELEEKRKRALRKIKVVKENLCQTKQRRVKKNEGCKKRKRTSSSSQHDDSKEKDSNESVAKQSNDSDESICKKIEVFHSTPYAKGKIEKNENKDCRKKVTTEFLEDIRQELPPFQSYRSKYSELAERSQKKLHYVEHFLKLPEIINFLDNFDEKCPPKLFLKASLRRFFQVFHKWLKRPHKHELNASVETKALLENYLSAFNKIHVGISHKNKKLKKETGNQQTMKPNEPHCKLVKNSHLANANEWKDKDNEKKKDEDGEDGFISILPLKKRKSTVKQIEEKTETTNDSDFKSNCSENVSHTQNFLQDIDVDRFLFQIHGQANR